MRVMTNEQLHILLIDDHSLIRDGYITALEQVKNHNPKLIFNIKEAHDCDSAVYMLDSRSPHGGWDLIFLDLSLPASTGKKFISGEDIGIYVRERFPETKIIIITTFDSSFRIQNIFKSINPEGFMVKSDITAAGLVKGIIEILDDSLFYSRTVLHALRKHIHHGGTLDEWDRRILYELSRGTKMVNLPKVIPFSLATIERRKKRMKEDLGAEGDDDKELLNKAKQMGFI